MKRGPPGLSASCSELLYFGNYFTIGRFQSVWNDADKRSSRSIRIKLRFPFHLISSKETSTACLNHWSSCPIRELTDESSSEVENPDRSSLFSLLVVSAYQNSFTSDDLLLMNPLLLSQSKFTEPSNVDQCGHLRCLWKTI